MSIHSNIEWTDATWNPIVGCSIVSPGCTNCYAMRMAGTRLDRDGGPAHYRGTTQPSKAGPVWTGKVALAPEATLLAPLRWRKPATIFVNSMGDLFHESIPDEAIDRVFAVMALCPQHTVQVLTKRAERMRAYVADGRWSTVDIDALAEISLALTGTIVRSFPQAISWPLPNVWLGISAERQQEWDERKNYLRATPAAVHFASFEPLLGPIVEGNFAEYIQWAIVGGESGPNARPMHPYWARSLRDQCEAAGVPFFFKQWGELIDADVWFDDLKRGPSLITNGIGGKPWEPQRPLNFEDAAILASACGRKCEHHSDGSTFIKVGKKAAGRLLDGKEWNQIPETRR